MNAANAVSPIPKEAAKIFDLEKAKLAYIMKQVV